MTGPTAAVLKIVKERDGGKCLRCGRPSTNTQHRIGRGMGGSRRPEVNSPAALASICGSGATGCHGYITQHPTEAYATGWAIRRSSTTPPSQIPLVDIAGRSWFLTEEGDIKPTRLGGLWPEHPELIEEPF